MLNQRILEALRKIRDEGPEHRNAGICVNVNFQIISANLWHDYEAVEYRLQAMLTEWPLFVSRTYPVGGVGEYVSGCYNRTLWDNPRRHELLHWLISYMENEVCPQ